MSSIPATLEGIRKTSQQLHDPELPFQELTETVEGVLTHQINHSPRSLQREIGPSEIGTDCDHCLAAKLAKWPQAEQGLAWASTVGTAIHEKFENFFELDMINHGSDLYRFWTEQKTMVGIIGGREIWGSTDLLDVKHGATVDWKCVSDTSLANYKRKGPSQVYKVQAHLYAKGWNDAGIPVRTVSICFLPRTGSNFYKRHWWSEPYNRQIAIDALDRANRIHNNLVALESISVETRDNWIKSLPRADRCWDCSRFPDWEKKPETSQGVLMDIPTSKPKALVSATR